jgi:hypothetical protein
MRRPQSVQAFAVSKGRGGAQEANEDEGDAQEANEAIEGKKPTKAIGEASGSPTAAERASLSKGIVRDGAATGRGRFVI